MTRMELIAALEAATGPSRELDTEIARLCHPTNDPRLAAFENGRDYPDLYTSSIDAALMLVPNRWQWTLYSDGSGEIYKDVSARMLPGAPGSRIITFEGSTPAIALCIAALRASGDA